MKRSKILAFGMLALVLAMGFVLAGCGSGTYQLKWGATFTSYSRVESVIDAQGWPLADRGENWALVTGSTATAVQDWCVENVSWLDAGDFEGPYEDCINFSKDGVSVVPGLLTALKNNKGKAPLAGIFDAGGVAVLFYITKK